MDLTSAKNLIVAERFWSRVKIGKKDDCWEWQAGKFQSGYGGFIFEGRTQKASRVAWILTNGPIPRHDSYHGTCVLHRCDNPGCCNPNHLFLGTVGDNNADRSEKDRTNKPKGESHPNARLSGLDVLAIISLAEKGCLHRQIAKIYGVSRNHISNIVSGHRWPHLEEKR